MNFKLNQFLLAVSSALDFVEIDIAGQRTNHAKRVAYLSLRIAKELMYDKEDLYDIVSLAILHDVGISEAYNDVLNDNLNFEEHKSNHCITGEESVKNYPFVKDRKNIIKYHHEKLNGSGFFKLKGNEIPFISQIICFADYVENRFVLDNINCEDKEKIKKNINGKKGVLFYSDICEAFLKLLENTSFILDLKESYLDTALRKNIPEISMDLELEKIKKITDIFSKIIDLKSKFTREHSKGIANKISTMADYYKFDKEEKTKLIIAANLHDLGKLAMPNNILDKPGKLEEGEFEIIRRHTYYTRFALEQIDGFEDITEWAANHHEKLNGNGYPYGKSAKELDFNSRLMACTDIYQALTEVRPYRTPLEHSKVIAIMKDMAEGGFIDKNIVSDIDEVFGGNH